MTGRVDAEARAATALVQLVHEQAQLAHTQAQLTAMMPHVSMLRGQTVRMQECISTAHALLGMVEMHPTRIGRYVSEVLQVLEPELDDGVDLEERD